jgi:hypothetical protein
MDRTKFENDPKYIAAVVRSVESHYLVLDTIADDAGKALAYIVGNEIKTHVVSVTADGLHCDCIAATHSQYCCHRAAVTSHLIQQADKSRKATAPVAQPAADVSEDRLMTCLPVMPTAAQMRPHLYR